MSRFANTASFWNDVYSPAEIFEVEPPFELSRGDISAIGEGAVPHVASNWFLGEPQLLDNRDFARMLDVYQTYMGQRL